jgi:chorismate mutase
MLERSEEAAAVAKLKFRYAKVEEEEEEEEEENDARWRERENEQMRRVCGNRNKNNLTKTPKKCFLLTRSPHHLQSPPYPQQ